MLAGRAVQEAHPCSECSPPSHISSTCSGMPICCARSVVPDQLSQDVVALLASVPDQESSPAFLYQQSYRCNLRLAVQCRMSPDLGNLIGLDDSSSSMTQAPPGPFRLPPAYEEAKEHKVAAVADLRSAVKQVTPVVLQSIQQNALPRSCLESLAVLYAVLGECLPAHGGVPRQAALHVLLARTWLMHAAALQETVASDERRRCQHRLLSASCWRRLCWTTPENESCRQSSRRTSKNGSHSRGI